MAAHSNVTIYSHKTAKAKHVQYITYDFLQVEVFRNFICQICQVWQICQIENACSIEKTPFKFYLAFLANKAPMLNLNFLAYSKFR